MINTAKKNSTTDFSPLSWAILFFSFWYTLRSLGNYVVFSWLLFGMSIILISSIYCTWLRRKLGSPRAVKMILPTIFILTVGGFIIGVLLALEGLTTVDQIIAVALSFFLLGTWVMVGIASLERTAFRIGICVVIVVLFSLRLGSSGFELSWPLLIILAQGIWGAVNPERFRNIPLV